MAFEDESRLQRNWQSWPIAIAAAMIAAILLIASLWRGDTNPRAIDPDMSARPGAATPAEPTKSRPDSTGHR
jgi:hypothetical protein